MAATHLDGERLDERILEVASRGLTAALERNPPRRRRALDAPINVLSEPLERYLIAIEGELKHANGLLERLVALEEERREGERGMEALAQSLMPGGDVIDADQIDWFREGGGKVWVREGEDGMRPPTEAEAAALSAAGAFQRRKR